MSLKSRGKLLLFVASVVAVWKNIQLERRMRTEVEKMNALQTWIHTLIFLARIFPEVLIRRLLGMKSITSNWWTFEEIVMKVIHFHAKLGDVNVPNVFLGGFTSTQMVLSKLIHGLHIAHLPPSAIGFGPNSVGRKRFGKSIECTALWTTLEPNISYETPGVVKLLYFHGGGFVIGQAGMYIGAHYKMLKDFRDRGITAGIIDVEYPLAPQVKHPVPIEICSYVYDYLVHQTGRIRPDDLVIGGDSAGGMIALNVGLRATRWGCSGIMLCSPWVGHSLDSESHEEFADIDFIGGKLLIEQYQEAHVQGGKEASVTDHLLDVFGSRKDIPFCALPPVWISVGGFEVFKDDILRFAKELESHDVNVELYFANEVPHIYPMLWPLFIERSGPALEDCVDFFVRNLNRAREESRKLNESLTTEEVTMFKKVLSSTDVSGEFLKSLGESAGDTGKLKAVLSSSSFANLIQ